MTKQLDIAGIFEETVGQAEIEGGAYLGDAVSFGFRQREFNDRKIIGFSVTVVPTAAVAHEVDAAVLREIGTVFIDMEIRRPRSDTQAYLTTLAEIGVPFTQADIVTIANGIVEDNISAVEETMKEVNKRVTEPLPVAFDLVENTKAKLPQYRWNGRNLRAAA